MIQYLLFVVWTKASCETWDHKYFQPFGPKMCEKFCMGESGCTDHLFDYIQLDCTLIGNTSSTSSLSSNTSCKLDRNQCVVDKQSNSDIMKIMTINGTMTSNTLSANDTVEKGKMICLAVNDFFIACKDGNLFKMKRLLSKRIVNINCRESEGRTAVMEAAWYEQRKAFDFLVKQNCNLSAVDKFGDTVLHYACDGGSLYIVKKLLDDQQLDIESKGQYGKTPLMSTIPNCHIQLFKFLHQRGADIKLRNDNNDTILHIACKQTYVTKKMVKLILKLNVTDIESRGHNGNTPLMYAVEICSREIVDILLERGADINTVNDMNNTILHAACCNSEVDMVKYVLSFNIIDINCRGHLGRTPVMFAVKEGNTDVVRLLKGRGADMKTVDNMNNTILHLSCVSGDVDIVKYVLSLHIIDIDCRGHLGTTPVMFAVKEGNTDVVRLLKGRGADMKALDDMNNNILHLSCVSGDVDIVKYVLSLHIIDINCRGHLGRTPVMFAVKEGNTDVVRLLKGRGADMKTVDNMNNTILHLSCVSGDVDIVKYVLSLHINDIDCRGHLGTTPVMFAVKEGNTDVVRLLKGRGADMKTVDNMNNTILHLSCVSGDVDIVKYVLSLHIIDINCIGHLGRTPVMFAVKEGNTDVVRLLKGRGADMKALDDMNNSILHLSCVSGSVDIVKYVFSMKVFNVDYRGNFGRSPLMFAVENGKIRVFQLLLRRYKAKISTKDDNGLTVLHIACQAGKLNMVKYLVSLKELKGFEVMKTKAGHTPLNLALKEGHRNIVSFLTF